MKSLIKKNLMLVLMLGTFISYAKEDPIATSGTKKVKVEYKDVKKGHQLIIKDEKGHTVYSKTIQKSGDLSQTLDLTTFKNGDFVVELSKDFEIIVKPFTIASNLVSFSKEKELTVFKPVIKIREDLILISKISFEKDPIDITLYYEDEAIYSETLKGEEDILSRVYRLSKENPGVYKVVVKSDKRSYENDFTL